MSGRLQGLPCPALTGRFQSEGWERKESLDSLLVQHSQLLPHMEELLDLAPGLH